MDKDAKAFLYRILDCHAPTGDEQRLQRLLREWAEPFADRVTPDEHGNLQVVINPDAPLRVMLAGHCDQIGFLVMRIDQDGFVLVDALGGVDESVLPGSRVVIYGPKGTVPGVIGKTAVHNESSSEQSEAPRLEDLWIDVGAASREEAERIVEVGNYATFEAWITELEGDRIAAPALDNALGLWAVMETARRCAERGVKVALHCVSTVQEEIGSRGALTRAQAIRPHIAIAVDTTLALDDPGHASKKTDTRVRIGDGPTVSVGPNTNSAVGRRLEEAAKAAGVGCQREPHSDLESNDAKSLQVAGGISAAGSVGIPIRNMHTQAEVASLADAEATAKLLTEFVCALPEKLSLLPIDDGPAAGKQRATPGRRAGLLGRERDTHDDHTPEKAPRSERAARSR